MIVSENARLHLVEDRRRAALYIPHPSSWVASIHGMNEVVYCIVDAVRCIVRVES